MRHDTILVLDFGGQYAHLITRRVRDLNVYSEVAPFDVDDSQLTLLTRRSNLKGIILSGGPSDLSEGRNLTLNINLLGGMIPVLGICYGHQLLAHLEGGSIAQARKAEYGVTVAEIERAVGVLEGLRSSENVWMSHRDSVVKLPRTMERLASTENCAIAAFRHKRKPLYGLQWHTEVTHTESGDKILSNFMFKICGCRGTWKPENLTKTLVKEIRRKIGNEKAVVALSGGVDSSTTAALASRAVGKQMTAVLVDHGFMREGEIREVKRIFSEFPLNLVVVNASKQFMSKLKGVRDPEVKRRIIGEAFIRVFENEARNIGATILVQGTTYPDKIESGFGRHSDKIKSHHNVAGLPSKMDFEKIVEPLSNLYKDEIRKIARQLNLPATIVKRHPFPGPGLAVRIVGEVDDLRTMIVRRADKIVDEEITSAGLAGRLWQYFAVLTDSMSTGVKGDTRAYGYTVAIRAVESREGMTASFARLPYAVLERISTRITNEIPEVTRVVYDVTHKPPATIEWE